MGVASLCEISVIFSPGGHVCCPCQCGILLRHMCILVNEAALPDMCVILLNLTSLSDVCFTFLNVGYPLWQPCMGWRRSKVNAYLIPVLDAYLGRFYDMAGMSDPRV